MARTQETYYAVMNSPLVTDAEKQAYHILWTPTLGNQLVTDGLTKGEVAMQCELQGWPKTASESWEKAVAMLSKFGLVKKVTKRHCTAKHKEDVVWALTDSLPIKPKANKPSAKQFPKAVAQMEMMMVYHESRGDGMVTPELTKLYEWVKDKIPEGNSA